MEKIDIKKLIIVILGVILVGGISYLGYLKTTEKENESQKQEILENKKEQNKEKRIIYTTFFPIYDLTKRIVGDKWEIRTIIENGEEPHDFELKTNDMKELTKADLIIYNGAGMESFIQSIKDSIKKENKFLDLSVGLTLLKTSNDENAAVNPHTWLSPKNAVFELESIYKKVSSLDNENEEEYKENFEKAKKEFLELDEYIKKELVNIPEEKRYFVVSHAAFNYLAHDYNLKQVAISGISPEEEPSANELKKIADFVQKHNIKTIFFEGKATPKVAKTLAKTAGVKTDTLCTMETVTEEEKNRGYLELMKENIENLVRSFNE